MPGPPGPVIAAAVTSTAHCWAVDVAAPASDESATSETSISVPAVALPGLTVTATCTVAPGATLGSAVPLVSGVETPFDTSASDAIVPALVAAVTVKASGRLPPLVMVKVRTNGTFTGAASVAGLQPCSFGPTVTADTVETVAVTVLDVTEAATPLRSVYVIEAVLEMMVSAGVVAAPPRVTSAAIANATYRHRRRVTIVRERRATT